jgi:hypothetical protein
VPAAELLSVGGWERTQELVITAVELRADEDYDGEFFFGAKNSDAEELASSSGEDDDGDGDGDQNHNVIGAMQKLRNPNAKVLWSPPPQEERALRAVDFPDARWIDAEGLALEWGSWEGDWGTWSSRRSSGAPKLERATRSATKQERDAAARRALLASGECTVMDLPKCRAGPRTAAELRRAGTVVSALGRGAGAGEQDRLRRSQDRLRLPSRTKRAAPGSAPAQGAKKPRPLCVADWPQWQPPHGTAPVATAAAVAAVSKERQLDEARSFLAFVQQSDPAMPVTHWQVRPSWWLSPPPGWFSARSLRCQLPPLVHA